MVLLPYILSAKFHLLASPKRGRSNRQLHEMWHEVISRSKNIIFSKRRAPTFYLQHRMGNGCVWQLLIRKVVVVVLVCQSQPMFFLPYMTGHLHIIFSFKTHALPVKKLRAGDIMLYTASFLACTRGAQVTELSPDSAVL